MGRGRMKGAVAGAVLLLVLGSGVLQAQDADAMRRQLALGYLQLELALGEPGSAEPATRERLNREFDRLTLLFFAGNMQGALGVLESLVAEAAGEDASQRQSLRARAMARLTELDGMRRVERIDGQEIAYLLHLPPGQAPVDGWPVVVAVHGAGGDERMFFGGYGAGSIRELADRHGVAVLTPAAPLSPAGLFGLVDAMATRERLNAARIALVGHSMGAGVVSRAAGEHPERVRAVACLAGGCAAAVAGAGEPVPVFLAAGVLDPLFRVEMLAAQAGSLGQGGREVVFRRFEVEGHTLVVGEALPEVMGWVAERLRR
jgi:predicted esterase